MHIVLRASVASTPPGIVRSLPMQPLTASLARLGNTIDTTRLGCVGPSLQLAEAHRPASASRKPAAAGDR